MGRNKVLRASGERSCRPAYWRDAASCGEMAKRGPFQRCPAGTLSQSKPIRFLLALAATFIPLCGSGAAWHFTEVGKVVAISDVHGAYAAMVRTLKNAEVLDEAVAWRAGPAHLVITGDILDRGPDSRQVMATRRF